MRETLRLETETGRPGMEHYGFQVWSFPAQDSFQLNGMFGQYAVVLPEHDMVVAATGGDPALFSNRVLEATDRFFGTGASACYARWLARHPRLGARHLFEDTFPEDRRLCASCAIPGRRGNGCARFRPGCCAGFSPRRSSRPPCRQAPRGSAPFRPNGPARRSRRRAAGLC